MSTENRLTMTDRQLLTHVIILHQLLDTLHDGLSNSSALYNKLCIFILFIVKGII